MIESSVLCTGCVAGMCPDVVSSEAQAITGAINLAGLPKIGSEAQVTVMKGDSFTAKNTLAEPKKVIPITTKMAVSGPSFAYGFAPRSIRVIRVKGSPEGLGLRLRP